MRITIYSLYHYFNHINYLNYSDYSFLWLFAVVPDEPPLHEQQPLPDSSWFVVDEPTQLPHALCRPLAHAGRATISTVTTIAVITAERRSNGPCCGRGGFADAGRPCGTAWHCQPPRARRLAAAGPPDCQPSLARPRPPLTRRTARQCLPPFGQRGSNGALR